MKEIWKDIKDYEGLYQVSNLGRVKSIGRNRYDINNKAINFIKEEKIRKTTIKHGYIVVGLYKDHVEKKKSVHRLVAEAFIPNPNNYKEVNHKDENKQNNCVDNLEWCTRKYNVNYGTAQQRRRIYLINRHKKANYERYN